MNDTRTRYARIEGSKGSDTGPYWYRIFDKQPTELGAIVGGPYRDHTDAENAAHDRASAAGWELEWTN